MAHYKTPEQKLFIKANVVESLALMLSLLNIGKNMDARQIEATCQMVIDEPAFKHLSPAELREAFSRGVRGNYGKNYDSVDVQRVFGWVHSYNEERFAEIENYRTIEIADMREASKRPFAALAKLNIGKPIKDVRTYKQPHLERTTAELELDGYLAEFDALVGKTEQSGPIKFVEYAGEHMDVSTYCNKRWEEARK